MDDEYDIFYLAFGKAVLAAQGFEFNLGTLLISLDRLIQGNLTVEALFALDEKYSRLTMGQLLVQLRTKISVSKSIEERLKEGLNNRNFLIHRFYSEEAECLISEMNIDKMVNRMDEMRQSLLNADSDVKALILGIDNISGFPQEFVEQEHIKLLNKYGRKE